MMLNVEQKIQDGSTRLSQLNFADLAGSEKVKKTEATGTRLEEAKMINKSLSQLGIVIRALSEKKNFISFRDSILTHILKDSLGGNTKTTLLCTCSPHIYNRAETLSTLRFATRAKLVSNTVYKNTVLSPQQMTKLIKNLRTEIVDLKRKLQDKVITGVVRAVTVDYDDDHKDADFAMEKSAMALDPAMQKQLVHDLQHYKEEHTRLEKDIERNKTREEELQRLVAKLRSEIEDWKEKHSHNALELEHMSGQLEQAKKLSQDKQTEVEALQSKITELNAQLLQQQSATEKKEQQNLQLSFLSTLYENKLKRVEEDEKEMQHQLTLIEQYRQRSRDSVTQLQADLGQFIDTKTESKIAALHNESKFYEEQHKRMQTVLKLFEQEKSLLMTKDDTLTSQLKTLQKYLDLKDQQIGDARQQLRDNDDQLKLKELQIARSQHSNQQLNDTIHGLQEQNAALDRKLKAYFAFNERPNPATPPTSFTVSVQATPIWEATAAGGRNRGASEFVHSLKSAKSKSAEKDHQKRQSVIADADNLLKQQEYLAEFARLRSMREKEKLDDERRRRQLEREEALKRAKAEEIKLAAAERNQKSAQQEQELLDDEDERDRRGLQLEEPQTPVADKSAQNKDNDQQASSSKDDIEKKPSDTEETAEKKTSSGANDVPKRKLKDTPAFLRAGSSDKDTLTKKTGRKKLKRWKSSRSKVKALISGFEQIEDEEDVFENNIEDDATMMLRMLENSAIKETDPQQWSVDDVVSWLKSINLPMYESTFREHKIDGSILYNDITELTHLTAIGVQTLHANKLLREINVLRAEQQMMLAQAEDTKLESVALDPFEMIRDLFFTMDTQQRGYIDRADFDDACKIAGVTTLNATQTDMVYNQFHVSTESGITEEEMLLALGKIFVHHHCTDAKMAFRLACIEMLQSMGLISGYADSLEDLFENVAEVQQNMIEWQSSDGAAVNPFYEEKLMRLMKMAGNRVCVIDEKRVRTIEEFDDMTCARMAGDGVHLSVIKIWWSKSTIHGIQSTYTSLDGKMFTCIRHASNAVGDGEADSEKAAALQETVILLKHDEFVKYVSVSATNLVHAISVVTTAGTPYNCGHNVGDQIIQYKPPQSCGVIAFYGSVTHRGLCSFGVYAVKNEKLKLKMQFKKGVENTHRRTQLRVVLRAKLNGNVNVEEAIGYIMNKYDELNVRRLCEASYADKEFVQKIADECNKVCKDDSIVVARTQRRKKTALNFEFKRNNSQRLSSLGLENISTPKSVSSPTNGNLTPYTPTTPSNYN